MPHVSAYLSDEARKNYRRECRFYVTSGVVLVLSGLLVLALPAVPQRTVIAFAASWLTFMALILSLLRPAAYGKGLADTVMGIITAFFYGLVGWLTGSASLGSADSYRLIIFAVLIFASISRLLVFARMLMVTALPMLAVSCAAYLAAGVLILLGYPGGSAAVYWFIGMLLLVDAAELFAQAGTLSGMAERDS